MEKNEKTKIKNHKNADEIDPATKPRRPAIKDRHKIEFERIGKNGPKRAANPLQLTIGDWARRTFPNQDESSIIAHLKKEVLELEATIPDKTLERSANETADCAILLFGFADLVGFDLLGEVIKKHEINKTRTWGEPDANGVIEHIPEPCKTCNGKGYLPAPDGWAICRDCQPTKRHGCKFCAHLAFCVCDD